MIWESPKWDKSCEKQRFFPPAFWTEKGVIKRPWIQWTQRESPRHHMWMVYPGRCQGVRSQGDDGVHRYAYSVVMTAYVDNTKISLASSGTAANFAPAAQGTIWTANFHRGAGEAPGRTCSRSMVLSPTPLVVQLVAGGKSLQTMTAAEMSWMSQCGKKGHVKQWVLEVGLDGLNCRLIFLGFSALGGMTHFPNTLGYAFSFIWVRKTKRIILKKCNELHTSAKTIL